jgi:hypothetical protein
MGRKDGRKEGKREKEKPSKVLEKFPHVFERHLIISMNIGWFLEKRAMDFMPIP